ncbi:MAG: DUF4279 domain-containing protein [Spirochaetales bacterium]|nr:DUF4279 domain-containing protein [Spirochaetales bacterium]
MNTEYYFNFSVSFRIMNAPEYHEKIKENTKIVATHVHKKGDIKSKTNNKRWENDIWILSSPLPKESQIDKHIEWLWQTIEPHIEFFFELKEKNVKMDIFCGYRTNCDNGGFNLDTKSIEILNKFKIPIGFSIIIA